MKKNREPKNADNDAPGGDVIAAYSDAQSLEFRPICNLLRELIDSALPERYPRFGTAAPSGLSMRTRLLVTTRLRRQSTSCSGTARRSTSPG